MTVQEVVTFWKAYIKLTGRMINRERNGSNIM